MTASGVGDGGDWRGVTDWPGSLTRRLKMAELMASKHVTLTGDQVETVDLGVKCPQVLVTSDGDAAVFFTTDGSTPAVDGDDTWKLPAVMSERQVTAVGGTASTVVKLISSGTPDVSVYGAA